MGHRELLRIRELEARIAELEARQKKTKAAEKRIRAHRVELDGALKDLQEEHENLVQGQLLFPGLIQAKTCA